MKRIENNLMRAVLRVGIVVGLVLFAVACRVDRKHDDPQNRQISVKCETDAYYIENLCEDELEYLQWAEDYKENPRLEDLNAQVLHEITQETKDVDKAAAVFYTRVLRDRKNKAFYDFLERKEEQIGKNPPDYSDLNILLAHVPGMFYADNPDIGADGAKLRTLVEAIGLKSDLVKVDQTGTVQENAKFVCEYLKNRTDVTAIILSSVSKGSSDIKYAVKLCGHEPYFEKVIGWYNIGGINRGSRLVNALNDDWSNKWEARTYFCLNGYDWDGLMSMRFDEDSPLNFEADVPENTLVINVIGVPIWRTVSNRARPYYEYLVRYGPNDGISLIGDLPMPNAVTWVSWRNDHYFRWPISEAKVQGFVVYIVEQRMSVIRRLRNAK